ncbi:diguanylate cyclase domain-containing protein [Methylobacterium sp. J-076]|uniref:sensor domain-containing diguanylate cyclase n=1 Tax=Methylobacterium sp. J-076 TaxID=2836655 RepID=UPI001FBB2E83|nr:diguanylate cyclase [Methylobacterium sp. J-076]MCJ2012398.1 diguanylate cyclase [Methylobacterium sp. J-076]
MSVSPIHDRRPPGEGPGAVRREAPGGRSGGLLGEPRRLLAIVAIVVIGGMWAYAGWMILDLRRQAWANARHDAASLLSTSERALSRDIELYDMSLRTVADLMNLSVLEGVSPEVRHLSLFDRLSRARGYGSIFVLDSNGDSFLESGAVVPRRLNGTDQPYFTVQRDDAEGGLFIGAPRSSRITGQEVIPLSRRFSYADGKFAGVIVGAIQLSYIREIFDRLKGDSAFTVALTFRDGVTTMTTEATAVDLKGPGLRESREVLPWPLHLSVFLPESAIDEAWMPQTRPILTIALLLSAAILGVLVLLHREFGRREEAERQALAAQTELERLAATDALTGLWNRRRFERTIARCADPATRPDWALMAIDADHFKWLNDRYGHPAGDRALRSVAAVLITRAAASGGEAFRVGGEEFALLVACGPEEALRLAESIRAGVAALALPHADHPRGILTLSVGLAHGAWAPEASLQDWMDEADEALYAAKRQGRDRVCLAREGAPREPGPAPPVRLAAGGR